MNEKEILNNLIAVYCSVEYGPDHGRDYSEGHDAAVLKLVKRLLNLTPTQFYAKVDKASQTRIR